VSLTPANLKHRKSQKNDKLDNKLSSISNSLFSQDDTAGTIDIDKKFKKKNSDANKDNTTANPLSITPHSPPN
jgi:hypothetical protein